MSVGAWLDTVILDSALDEGIEPARLAQPQYDPYDDQDADRNETTRSRPAARDRYVDEDAGWDEDAQPRRRKSLERTPAEYDQHHRPAPDADGNETTRSRPPARDRYVDEDAGWDDDARPRRRKSLEYDEHHRPVPIDDHDVWAGYEDLPHLAAREARRRAAADDARRPAAELEERLPPVAAPVEDRYLPVVDQGFAEVRDRLDSLTRQLSRLAQENAANAQVSRPDHRDEEPLHELVEVKDRLDNLTQQLSQHTQMHVAQMHVANEQMSRPDPRDEAPPRELVEVTDRLDSLTQQLGQLAQMHAENSQISRSSLRVDEPPRELLEVKDRLDGLTQQIGQLAQLHVANAQISRLDRRDEEHPRELIEVKDRLDGLTQQIGQLAQLQVANVQISRSDRPDEQPPRELVEAISQLDRRLDQLIAEGRSTKTEMEQRVNAVDRAVADLSREKPHAASVADPPTPLDQALIEIADRQRALDGYAPIASGGTFVPAAMSSAALPRARTQELSGLEQQLRQINTQIETLRQPCGLDKAVDTLRDDLAEIGLMLQDAMPRKAVEALESEVRNLADRVDNSRHAGADGTALMGVERGLAEVRDALRELTPAENLIGVDQAVQQLSQKIDLIASNAQDPAALKQLEGTILAMRGIVSHVASNDALAKLSEEVRALAGKVDQAASSGGASILSALESRIAALADAMEARNQGGQGAPHELDTVVKGLIDKIERIQLTRGDQAALGHLEDRIAKLVEKLDASDARLNHLEAIERGLAELLIHLEHQRVPNLARAGASLPPEVVDVLSRDVADLRHTEKKTLDTLEVVHGTLGHVVDRLAMIETDIRSKPAQPTDAPPAPKADLLARPAAPAAASAAANPVASKPVANKPIANEPPPKPATAAALPPAPTLPAEPTQPVEFIGVPPASRPAAAPAPERRPIDPNLPPDHPLEPGSGVARGRNNGSPADRIAASEAALGAAKPPVIPDPGGKANFIAAARRAAQAAGRDAPAKGTASAPSEIASAAGKLASRVGKLRALIGGTTAILLVLGTAQLTRTLLGSSDEAGVIAPGAPSQVAAVTPDSPPVAIAAPAAGEPRSPSAPPPAGRQSVLLSAVDGTTIATPSPGIVIPLETARQVTTDSQVTTAPQMTTAPKVDGPAPAAEREATGSIRKTAKPETTKPAVPLALTPAPVAAPALAAAQAQAAAQVQAMPASLSNGPDKLPAVFSSSLRAAAAKGDPAAQYEVALRYLEGRGVPPSPTDAAEWFERAAKQGLVPAQFRLGGLYEKGFGVKKDLDTARRFYVAAGEGGNAKALHNLAVLYAEGIDGKPDYQTAARWFRKASDYGVTDSQYNLAILYARGIGVEQNLAEAYRWFTLAAREGDTESAKKRDDVGARLDPQSLQALTQAAQAWKPEQQPESALQVKTPPGGWDGAATSAPAPASKPAPATGKRKQAVAGPKLDLATPHLPQ